MPTAPKSLPTSALSAAVTPRPQAMAVAPSPTSAGVFGIVRTRRAWSAPSSDPSVTPAAIETTSFARPAAGAIAASTAGISCGLTARTITAQRRARSALSAAARTRYPLTRRARRAASGSLIQRSAGRTTFPPTSPRIRASPMFPAPINPIIVIATLLYLM